MNKIKEIYEKLLDFFGNQNWWPTISENKKFEIVVGAILTQQTSWKNVEKAINNLIKGNLLTEESIHKVRPAKLEKAIRSSGFYRQKTKKLKNFTNFLFEKYSGRLDLLLKKPATELRKELFSINGIGKETADSIVLYAAEKCIFVVDAYTFKIMERYGISSEKNYDKIQKLFEQSLPRNVELFKEFHALIVQLGKDICKAKPKCGECPLQKKCQYAINLNNMPERKGK